MGVSVYVSQCVSLIMCVSIPSVDLSPEREAECLKRTRVLSAQFVEQARGTGEEPSTTLEAVTR